MWTVDGDSICRAPGPQSHSVMATDGNGGAIIAWKDTRVMDSDIYAQRITAGGDFVGTALCFFDCSAGDDGIRIEWRLSERCRPSDFVVSRSASAAGEFAELAGAPETEDGFGFTFIDRTAEPGTGYSYRIEITGESGRRLLFETEAVSTPGAALHLYQNVPNPFNPSTKIAWSIEARARVTIEIFDAAGRKVAVLVDGVRDAGEGSAVWNGTGLDGKQVSSGVYFYRLATGKRALTRKMVLLR